MPSTNLNTEKGLEKCLPGSELPKYLLNHFETKKINIKPIHLIWSI